ncbi:hypothetical protein E2C01_092894 [Portunus trituberculatus]|uniref:Uncharacterized protein n=1 Tax=Portunus trituberculatus TaxID=210409 RepID=A0A5B7JZ49_PORTR|nr:hypothetical protein [Portunus trituberculatus]
MSQPRVRDKCHETAMIWNRAYHHQTTGEHYTNHRDAPPHTSPSNQNNSLSFIRTPIPSSPDSPNIRSSMALPSARPSAPKASTSLPAHHS